MIFEILIIYLVTYDKFELPYEKIPMRKIYQLRRTMEAKTMHLLVVLSTL